MCWFMGFPFLPLQENCGHAQHRAQLFSDTPESKRPLWPFRLWARIAQHSHPGIKKASMAF